MHYNPISVPSASVACSGLECKCFSRMQDNLSNDNDDVTPVSAPTASNEV
jgi:hypothetical protein